MEEKPEGVCLALAGQRQASGAAGARGTVPDGASEGLTRPRGAGKVWCVSSGATGAGEGAVVMKPSVSGRGPRPASLSPKSRCPAACGAERCPGSGYHHLSPSRHLSRGEGDRHRWQPGARWHRPSGQPILTPRVGTSRGLVPSLRARGCRPGLCKFLEMLEESLSSFQLLPRQELFLPSLR